MKVKEAKIDYERKRGCGGTVVYEDTGFDTYRKIGSFGFIGRTIPCDEFHADTRFQWRTTLTRQESK